MDVDRLYSLPSNSETLNKDLNTRSKQVAVSKICLLSVFCFHVCVSMQCTCIYTFVCVYLHIYAHMHVGDVSMSLFGNGMLVRIFECIVLCVYACNIYICVCVHVYMYMYVYMCVVCI